MRPIKFRAWDTGHKKMWSAEEMGADELTINPDGRGFVNVHSASTRLSNYLPHMIPLQFTGLTDKNGKEIYEGDLLNWKQDNGSSTVGYIVYWRSQFGPVGFNIDPETAAKSEVIGNIHETKGSERSPEKTDFKKEWPICEHGQLQGYTCSSCIVKFNKEDRRVPGGYPLDSTYVTGPGLDDKQWQSLKDFGLSHGWKP